MPIRPSESSAVKALEFELSILRERYSLTINAHAEVVGNLSSHIDHLTEEIVKIKKALEEADRNLEEVTAKAELRARYETSIKSISSNLAAGEYASPNGIAEHIVRILNQAEGTYLFIETAANDPELRAVSPLISARLQDVADDLRAALMNGRCFRCKNDASICKLHCRHGLPHEVCRRCQDQESIKAEEASTEGQNVVTTQEGNRDQD